MKKLLPHIAALAAAALLVYCVLQISALKNDIRQMENNFTSELSLLQSQYGNVISRVERRLEEHVSILAHKDFTYGEADLDKYTFELLAEITPKEHRSDVTEAVITVNGKEYPMKLTGGRYTAEIELPLFEDMDIERVVFKEGDTVRTETLDWQNTPKGAYLPAVFARISGSARGSAGDGVYTWRRAGEVSISVDTQVKTTQITSVSLIEELDGVETNRIEIPLTNTESNRYAAMPEPPPSPVEMINGGETFYYELDRDFNIPFGSTMELLAEVVDGNGLRYRACVEHWEIDENGEPADVDAWMYRGFKEQIISPDGKILYDTDMEQFR